MDIYMGRSGQRFRRVEANSPFLFAKMCINITIPSYDMCIHNTLQNKNNATFGFAPNPLAW